jgi:hypothetical protein
MTPQRGAKRSESAETTVQRRTALNGTEATCDETPTAGAHDKTAEASMGRLNLAAGHDALSSNEASRVIGPTVTPKPKLEGETLQQA